MAPRSARRQAVWSDGNAHIGGHGIELEARTLQRRRQWHQKATLQVTVEAFDLTLGLRPVGTAHAQPETECRRQSQHSAVPAVRSFAVGVALDDHRLGAKAVNRRHTQYFEILGNRGIYSDGWLARTIHRAPWEPKPRASLDKDSWELFDTRNDYSLATDVAAKTAGACT